MSDSFQGEGLAVQHAATAHVGQCPRAVNFTHAPQDFRVQSAAQQQLLVSAISNRSNLHTEMGRETQSLHDLVPGGSLFLPYRGQTGSHAVVTHVSLFPSLLTAEMKDAGDCTLAGRQLWALACVSWELGERREDRQEGTRGCHPGCLPAPRIPRSQETRCRPPLCLLLLYEAFFPALTALDSASGGTGSL